MKIIHFGITKEKEQELYSHMNRLGLKEEDLEESFLLSGKKGGQNANKVATKVRLLHKPTGIVVTCAKERSQLLNRFFARRLLVQRMETLLNLPEGEPGKSGRNFSGSGSFDSGLNKKVAKKIKQKAKRKKRSRDKYQENEADLQNK